jgi:putative transposase
LRRNIHWFERLAEAHRLIEAWRIDFNESRPHCAIGNKTPVEYLLSLIALLLSKLLSALNQFRR